MSIRSWLARKAIEREIRRAEQGQLGPEAKDAMDWIKQHKSLIGLVAGFAAGGLHAIGQDEYAKLLGYAVTFLLGAGVVKSDAEHKAEAGK